MARELGGIEPARSRNKVKSLNLSRRSAIRCAFFFAPRCCFYFLSVSFAAAFFERDIFSAHGFHLQGRTNPKPDQGGALRRTFMLLREHLHSSLFGKTLVSKSMFGKAALATAALGGFFFLAFAPTAQAANHDDCRRRIAHAEHELGEAIEDHGYDSRQAN